MPNFAQNEVFEDAEDAEMDEEGEVENANMPNAVEDNEDMEDDLILNSDALIVVGCAEGQDYSSLEVYVYEKEKNNVYVHHEIMLNSFPLCLEWIPYNPAINDSEKYNFLAVGTFMPQIEIWNLDVMDTVQPAIMLGGTFDSVYTHGQAP